MPISGLELGLFECKCRTQAVISRIGIRNNCIEAIIAAGELNHHKLLLWIEGNLFSSRFREKNPGHDHSYGHKPSTPLYELSPGNGICTPNSVGTRRDT